MRERSHATPARFVRPAAKLGKPKSFVIRGFGRETGCEPTPVNRDAAPRIKIVGRSPGIAGFVVIVRRRVAERTFVWPIFLPPTGERPGDIGRFPQCMDAYRRHPKIDTIHRNKNGKAILSRTLTL